MLRKRKSKLPSGTVTSKSLSEGSVSASNFVRPAADPPTPVAHKASWLAVALAVIALLTQALNVFGPTVVKPTPHAIAVAAKPVVQAQAAKAASTALQRATTRAVGAAANTPVAGNQQACPNVKAMGQGAMGACSPPPATLLQLGAARASSVTVIRNHPIGTDTSSYQLCQAPPTWVSFWIVKATEGTGYTDRCVATDIAIAKKRGIPYGTYDFGHPTGADATAEAAKYVQVNRAAGASLGMHVYDAEYNPNHLPPSTVHAYICSWARYVHGHLGGTIIVYTGNWFWGPQVGGDNCGTVAWISAYANYAVVPPAWGGGVLTPSSRYRPFAPLWQYSDGKFGPQPYVNRWDTDVYFGTKAQLRALAGMTKPCSQRTACRMGRRHEHIHATIVKKCHGAPAASHRKICRTLRGRNRYIHRYVRKHHETLVTR